MSYFSNLGLYPHHNGVAESQILSRGPGPNPKVDSNHYSMHSSLIPSIHAANIYWAPSVDIISQPKEHPAFSAPASSPRYTATIK